jgi:hypothetical protein
VRKISVPTPQSVPVPLVLAAMTQLQASGGGPEIFPELAGAWIRCVQQLLREPALPAMTGWPQRLLEAKGPNKPKSNGTMQEHTRILEAEHDEEQKNYEMLWLIGAAQTDCALMSVWPETPVFGSGAER